MSINFESITFRNPSPSSNRAAAASMALCHAPPASLGFEALCRAKTRCKVSIPAPPAVIGVHFRQTSVRQRSVFSFAAPHEESASDIDIEKEKDETLASQKAQESEEEWKRTLESFRLKMKSILEKAELYLEKVSRSLEETMKIKTEKLREDSVVVAKEIVEESKEYLATAGENYPEPVKDIAETVISVVELNDISKARDFHVGIPYGTLLSVGGFISFMLTGSIPAIRFGIILGGTLLALSISSLRSWNKGEFSPLVLKGQTAIAFIMFLRDLRLLSTRPFIANFISILISGSVVAFYLYRIISDGGQRQSSNLEVGPEN